MAVIGEFKLSKAGGWEGEIRTLCLSTKVRMDPNDNRTNPNAPNYRVMASGAHIGDVWEHQSRADPPRTYYRVSLDDPLFTTPISATLFPNVEGTAAQLVWSRPAKPKDEARCADQAATRPEEVLKPDSLPVCSKRIE